MKKGINLACFVPIALILLITSLSAQTRQPTANGITPGVSFNLYDDPTDRVDTLWWTGNIDQHISPGQTISWDYDLPQNPGAILQMKYGLWNSPEVPLAVYVNSHRVGVWLADQGYITPGPEYGRVNIGRYIIAGSDHISVTAMGGGEAVIGYVAVATRTSGDLTDLGSENASPAKISTYRQLPNPFNPTTTISFQLPAPGHVNLSIYDITGKMVVELINGMREAGSHNVTFDGSNLGSGVYVYYLTAGESAICGKMVLIK
jgi:hypothetical protein